MWCEDALDPNPSQNLTSWKTIAIKKDLKMSLPPKNAGNQHPYQTQVGKQEIKVVVVFMEEGETPF